MFVKVMKPMYKIKIAVKIELKLKFYIKSHNED
jgi:hypothetical protein